MIWRIRNRRAFERFRCDGRRIRVGPLWMSVITDPAAMPPRVAFAVARSAGNAPLRNRLRRRLRALARNHASDLAPGWYLIGADAALAWSPFVEADAQFVEAVHAASAVDASAPADVSPRSTAQRSES